MFYWKKDFERPLLLLEKYTDTITTLKTVCRSRSKLNVKVKIILFVERLSWRL